MAIIQRFFPLDEQWNVIHLPEQPNGFGILLLGDKTHYVEEGTSFWIQNNGRNQIIEYLRKSGYTIFYSNLYGRNWGSEAAVSLCKQLYHVVMKREILNERIHLLAEGMGGLVALKLMEDMEGKIRSATFINPCLNIRAYLKQEQENKFFYKQLLQEMAKAYGSNKNEVEKNINLYQSPLSSYRATTPVKIYQTLGERQFPFKHHAKRYAELRQDKKSPIKLTQHVQEKKFENAASIKSFLQVHEVNLK